MKIKVYPVRPDGILREIGKDDFENTFGAAIICANICGARVRVIPAEKNEESEKSLKTALLSFNAKGTKINLKKNKNAVFGVIFAATYSCSETEIFGFDGRSKARIERFISDVSAVGVDVKMCGNGVDSKIIVRPRGEIKTEKICVHGDAETVFTTVFMTLSENPVEIQTDIKKGLAKKLSRNLSALCSKIEIE